MKKIHKNDFDRNDFVRAKVSYPLKPGEALKMLRELQGLSQNELTALTNIPQSNLSALENGTRTLGRERALTLAKALKVHPAVLLFPDFDLKEVV